MIRRLTLVAVVACVASSCSTSSPSVVIGAIYPTGGAQGPGGIEEYRGVELAAEYVNHDGGVRGRRLDLRLVPVEHREQAPSAVDALADDGIDVIVGSYGSTISLPAATAAARRGLVFWETGAVGELPMPTSAARHAFRFPASGEVLGRNAVAFVRDRLGLPNEMRYTVAYVDDVYGRSVGLGAIAEVNDSGLELAARLPYDVHTADYEDLVERIEIARTDVLVVASYLDDAVALRRAVVRRGVPLRANIGTSSSYCMLQFGALLGDDAVGLFASDKPDGAAVDARDLAAPAADALRWARRTYEQRHRAAMTAPALTGFAGALGLFRHVLRGAKSISRSDVMRAAQAVDLPRGGLPDGSGLRFDAGPEGVYANQRATNVIWEWVAPGRRAVVWPPEVASHAIVPPQ